VVEYHAQRNEEVYGTNSFDGTSQEGKCKRLLVN